MFNLNAILNIVGANTSSVKAAVSDINSEMDRGTRKARSFGDAVALKGANLGVFAVASTAVIKLTESISMATRDALRFEVEMAKIAQTVGISTTEARKHGEEIRKLSVLYGLSAPKIAETVRVLAQAGYTLRQAKEAADNLSQTTLLSSFESITDTTDGLIAVNKQFIDTIGKSAQVLSLFNVVSKKYAVESADLVEVVRKAGGTFSATGGKLEELLAVFTTVRDTTRESAETIAVGLRTIFTRLQRPKTIEYLQQFGIELVNLEGQFVGNFEAIQRIQRGLDAFGVRPGSIKFAEVVEEIGGVLQQSRVIPLLTQGAKLQQVYADAQSASSETAMDLAKAQDTLSFKIAQTQQNFAKLIGDIASSKGFDTLVRGVLSMTNAMIHFAAAIKDVLPLISALLAFNLAKSVGKLALGGPKAFLGKGFATGGFVPGSGSGDTVPAMLTPGEFVIRKSAAQAMGAEALHGINKYAKGGPVKIGKFRKDSLKDNPKIQGSTTLIKKVDDRSDLIETSSISLGDYSVTPIDPSMAKSQKLKNAYIEAVNAKDEVTRGNAFENIVSKQINEKNTENNAFLDFRGKSKSSDKGEAKSSNSWGVNRLSPNNYRTLLSKTFNEYPHLEDKELWKKKKNPTTNEFQPSVIAYVDSLVGKTYARKASGGAAGTDTVPSLLTPGEFVVNKKSAQAFGYGNLQKVNKYASGGVVGVQRFASGGPVGGDSLLSGLSGLGDLAIVVNQLIPVLSSATASFAKISIASSLVTSTFGRLQQGGGGLYGFLADYRAEADKLSEARIKEMAAYEAADQELLAITAQLGKMQDSLAVTVLSQATLGPAVLNTNADIAVSKDKAKSSIRGKALTSLTSAQDNIAKSQRDQSFADLELQFGPMSKELAAAKKMFAEWTAVGSIARVNTQDAADALKIYVSSTIEGNAVQRDLIEAQEKQQKAAQKATDEAGAAAGLNKGGIFSRLKGALKDPKNQQAVQDYSTMAVAAGAAFVASQLDSLAQAANKLTSEAITAGNAQGAYASSLDASAKEQAKAGVEIGASTGTMIGSMIAPLFIPLLGPFAALIPAIGGAIGGLLGFGGVISYITDLLGITDSKGDAEKKAREASKSANIKAVEKITNDSITKSNNLRQFNPNAANDELVKGFNKLQNSSAAQSLGNPATQEQSKQFYDQLRDAFEQLRTSSKNAGKGFDQLKRENFGLVSALERSSASLVDNDQAFKGLVANTEAASTAVNRERQTKLAAINLQLRQLAIQKQVNTSLAHMDSVIKTQNEALMGFAAALGEDYSPPDIGVDLTDLSSRNTSNPDYARGLNAVSSMGGPFAEQAAILGRAIPLLNNLQNSLINQSSAEIGQSFDAVGVSPEISKGIVSIIEDARSKATKDEPFNSTAVQQEVMDKAFKSLTEYNENGRKALNTELQTQLSLMKKQSELQKKQLEYRLAGLDAEREISDTIDKVRGTEADPRAARAARLDRAGTILQGTSLQGAPLAGDKSDIDKIGKALAAADLSKQRVVGKLQTVQDPNVRARLDEEMVGLTKETERLNEAMSSLGDVSKENAAIEAKIAKNQEKRAVVREAASNLAFGSGQDRKDFFRTLNQARGVAAFGTADVLRDKDKGGVFSFLKQMKDIPAFNGKTGQEVIDATTRNYLLNGLKVPAQKVEEIMKKMIPSEEQALSLMKENMTVDVARNALLAKILVALGGDIGFMKDPKQIAQVAEGMSTGGSATIFKPKGTDTVPAMLSPGEYVVSAKNAKNNMGTLAAINSGQTKYLAEGSEGSFKRSGSLSKNDRAKAEERAIAKLARQGVTSNESELAKKVRSQPQSFEATIPVAAATPEMPAAPASVAMATQSEPSPTHDQQKISADIISQGMRAKNERADRDAAFDRKWQAGLGKNATAQDQADFHNDYLLNKIQRAKDTMRDGVYAERTANEANDQKRSDKQLSSVAEMGTASSSVDVSSNIRSTIGNFGANSAENKASVAPLVGYDGRLATDYGYSGMDDKQKDAFRKKVKAQRDALTSGATRTGVDKRFGADSILTYGVTEEGIKSGLSGASGYGNKLGLNSYEQAAAGYKPADMLIASQRRDKGRGFRSTEGDKAAASTKRKMLQDRNSPEYFAYKAELDAKIAAKKLNSSVSPPANIAGGTKSDRKIRSKSTGPSYSDRQKASRSRVKASRIKNSRTAAKDKFNQMFNVALPQASPVGPTEEYGSIAQNQFLPARLSAEEQAAKDAAMEAERMPTSSAGFAQMEQSFTTPTTPTAATPLPQEEWTFTGPNAQKYRQEQVDLSSAAPQIPAANSSLEPLTGEALTKWQNSRVQALANDSATRSLVTNIPTFTNATTPTDRAFGHEEGARAEAVKERERQERIALGQRQGSVSATMEERDNQTRTFVDQQKSKRMTDIDKKEKQKTYNDLSGGIGSYHNGGILGGMPGRDKNLIMAERGEGILRNEAMKKIGPANFNQLNKTGEAPAQPRRDKAEMPDFSKLFDSLKTFGAQFNESVVKLVDMPKTFEINLASQGVNVNLNGAEFLAKLPELLRSTILDQIQSQIGTISSQVKKDLSTGK